jgi:hypothetical protein
MNLLEISNLVCSKLGKSDSQTVEICKNFIRQRYQMIFDSYLWRDSLTLISITAEAGKEEVILPYGVDRVIGVRSANHEITGINLSSLFQLDAGIFDRIGTPLLFSEQTSIATRKSPEGGSLMLVSSSNDDVGIEVKIRGELNGLEVTEEVQLDGTTPVSSMNDYDIIYLINKEETVGNVTVTNESTVEILALKNTEKSRRHVRLRLLETPQVDTILYIIAKRKADSLLYDESEPVLRGFENALLAFAEGDMLERLRQYSKAQIKYQEAAMQTELLKNVENLQSASMVRIIPEDV